jgi:thiosulfate dehydrogenase (quinone) large subunit
MKKHAYSRPQLALLLLLRFVTGWHLLYEGLAKILNRQWSSTGFLQESRWILSGMADWIISNPNILAVVDFLNSWGLVAIGLGVILGLFFKAAAITGALLLFAYYLNSPPLTGIEYLLPQEGNNLVVNKTLIQAVALGVLALFSTSRIFGLDALVINFKKRGIDK